MRDDSFSLIPSLFTILSAIHGISIVLIKQTNKQANIFTTSIVTMNRNELNDAFCFDDDENTETMNSTTVKTPSPHSLSVLNMWQSSSPNNAERHDDDSRQQDEEDESIALARQLMAEEAMASYQSSFQLLQQHSTQFSAEDYRAMQAAMNDDDDDEAAQLLNDQVILDDDDDEERDGSAYETLLELSERIGDVKAERWSWRAATEIAALPVFVHANDNNTTSTNARDDSECKCLVCQCEYETDETLCRLPCQHSFHAACVKPWLMKKDVCPYCRQSIVAESSA